MVPFASDLSQQVLEARRLRGELDPQLPHAIPLSPYLLPQQGLRRVVSDPEGDVPEGERLIPAWHFHGRRKG